MNLKLTSVLLASCCLLNACVGGLQVNRTPEAIGFRPVISHDTRAEEAVPFPQERSFRLWAQEMESGAIYIDDATIAYNNGWNAPKNWTDAALEFHACWPTDLDVIRSAEKGLQLNSFDCTEYDADVLMAKAKADNKAGSIVTLNFEHILSRVEFRMMQSLSEDIKLKVTRVELKGVATKGDYNTDLKDEWSGHSEFETYLIYDNPDGIEISSSKAEYICKDFYTIPQLQAAHLEVQCFIKYGTASWIPQTYEIDPLEIVWDPGRHYTYTLNLRMDELVCTAGISSWENR